MYLILSILIVWGTTIHAQTSHTHPDKLYVEEAASDLTDVRRNSKVLTLEIVLEQGMRKNYNEQIRKKSGEILLNQLQDNSDQFWFPNLNLTLQSSTQRVGTVVEGSRDSRTTRTPTGSFGLEVENFTVWNWGKDYLSFKNNKETIERNIEIQKEQTRNFRQNLISTYTKLLYLNEVLKLKKQQLRNASFVYRLNREKVPLKKVSKHGYYQSRSDYLRAQDEYYQAKINLEIEFENMAELLNDPPEIKYLLNDEFKYSKIKMTSKGAYKIAYKNSPFLRTAKLNQRTTTRDYEIALRNNLPLPTISIDLGSYKHEFGGDSTTRFATSAGNSIELVASVNATWTLFGDGGLLNRRALATSRMTKENAQLTLEATRRAVEKEIAKIYRRLRNIDDRLKILTSRVPSLKNRLDLALDSYLERKSSYTDYQLALFESYETQASEVELKWTHFNLKIQLAQLIGVEELPGHVFDRIVLGKEKGNL